MKNILFILIIGLFAAASTTVKAQTNKKDDNLVPGSETRIVKKDTTTLDIDVLAQLELGDMTMGEEIKINLKENKVEVAPAIRENIVKDEIIEVVAEEPQVEVRNLPSPKNVSSGYSSSGTRAFQVQKNVKMKRKRFKKKRRKKRRKSGNCYSF